MRWCTMMIRTIVLIDSVEIDWFGNRLIWKSIPFDAIFVNGNTSQPYLWICSLMVMMMMMIDLITISCRLGTQLQHFYNNNNKKMSISLWVVWVYGYCLYSISIQKWMQHKVFVVVVVVVGSVVANRLYYHYILLLETFTRALLTDLWSITILLHSLNWLKI